MQLNPNKRFKKDENEQQYQSNLIELEVKLFSIKYCLFFEKTIILNNFTEQLNELLCEISIPEESIKKYNDILKNILKTLKNLKPLSDVKVSIFLFNSEKH